MGLTWCSIPSRNLQSLLGSCSRSRCVDCPIFVQRQGAPILSMRFLAEWRTPLGPALSRGLRRSAKLGCFNNKIDVPRHYCDWPGVESGSLMTGDGHREIQVFLSGGAELSQFVARTRYSSRRVYDLEVRRCRRGAYDCTPAVNIPHLQKKSPLT